MPAPIPKIDRIVELVEAARGRGQEVDITVSGDGEQHPVGPLADTAGYRMAQESLANAARHAAGAPTHVRVEYQPNVVQITVENDAPGAPGGARYAPSTSPVGRGYGIAGMRERAELVGAQLTTGPTEAGGWHNQLTIPREHHADTTRSEQ